MQLQFFFNSYYLSDIPTYWQRSLADDISKQLFKFVFWVIIGFAACSKTATAY